MRRYPRLVASVAGAACVMAGMLIGLPAIFASQDKVSPALHSDHVSLLARPPSSRDKLPSDVRTWPFARHHYGQGPGSRLAYRNRTDRLYVVPAPRGELCLIRVSVYGNAGTCNLRSRLRTSTILMTFQGSGSSNFIVGVAADGWRSISYGADRAPVRSNVYAIAGRIGPTAIVLRGTNASRTVRLP
jgi:hypothetical protein